MDIRTVRGDGVNQFKRCGEGIFFDGLFEARCVEPVGKMGVGRLPMTPEKVVIIKG